MRPNQKIDAIFRIDDSINLYFEDVFKVSSQFNFANFGSQPGPDQKLDAMFEISNSRNPYFEILFGTFHLRLQIWWYVRVSRLEVEKIVLPEMKLDLVT